jgi:hypothetical protein
VTKIGELGTTQAATSNRRTRKNPEDTILHSHRRENLKSYRQFIVFAKRPEFHVKVIAEYGATPTSDNCMANEPEVWGTMKSLIFMDKPFCSFAGARWSLFFPAINPNNGGYKFQRKLCKDENTRYHNPEDESLNSRSHRNFKSNRYCIRITALV